MAIKFPSATINILAGLVLLSLCLPTFLASGASGFSMYHCALGAGLTLAGAFQALALFVANMPEEE